MLSPKKACFIKIFIIAFILTLVFSLSSVPGRGRESDNTFFTGISRKTPEYNALARNGSAALNSDGCSVSAGAGGVNLSDIPDKTAAGSGVPGEPMTAPKPVINSDELAGGDASEIHGLGLNRSPIDESRKLEFSTSKRTRATSIDLSDQLPPVGNQGQQGSCVAWATSYYYKSWSEKQEHGWDLDNTEHAYSPSFVYNQINGGQDNGSTFYDAFNLLETKGDVDIAEMPYDQGDFTTQPTASQLEAAKPYDIPGDWGYLWINEYFGPYDSPNDIARMKTLLGGGQMLVIGIPVYLDFPGYAGNPASPYYVYNESASCAGGHGLCVCGYDDNANPSGIDADHQGGFKIVNSWGPGWNGSSQGFLYLSYDFVKRYVLEAWAMGDNAPDTPSINSLSAGSGNVGAPIAIRGTNFGTNRRGAGVTFNGITATQVAYTDEEINVYVPDGATSGPLIAYDWEGTATNSMDFTVGAPPGPQPTVTKISPDEGSNKSAVSVMISGTGFVDGSQAKLVSGGNTIDGTGESFVSAAQIRCSFDLTGTALGDWDVVVTNPDSRSGELPGGFTVKGTVPQPHSPGYDWKDLKGPGNGSARRVAYDEAREILYRDVDFNGVWKYQGGQWTQLSEFSSFRWDMFYDSIHNVLYLGGYGVDRCCDPDTTAVWTDIGGPSVIDSFAYDSVNNILYADGSSSVWKCTNPDTNPAWTDIGGGISDYSVLDLVYDSSRNLLYAGISDQGVWRCTNPDGSPSWSSMGGDIAGSRVSNMDLDPVNNILYAGISSEGIWKCTTPDSTPSWTDLNCAPGYSNVTSLFYEEAHNKLYANITVSRNDFYRCDNPDTTPSWGIVNGPLQGFPIMQVIHDSVQDKLYLASYYNGVYECTNAWNEPSYVDIPSVGVMPSNIWIDDMQQDQARNILYVTTTGIGVWRCISPDTESAVWTSMGGAIARDYIHHLAYDSTNNIVYVSTGNFNGVWLCTNPDTSPSWTNIGFGGDIAAASLVCDEENNILYAGTVEYLSGGGYDFYIYKYQDGTWSKLDNGPESFYARNLSLDGNREILYASSSYLEYGGGNTWKINNPDTSPVWENIGCIPHGQPIYCSTLDTVGNVLYEGTRYGEIWRCKNPDTSPSWENTGLVLGDDNYASDISYLRSKNILHAVPDIGEVIRGSNPDQSAVWENTGGIITSSFLVSSEADEIRGTLFTGTADYGVWYAKVPSPSIYSCSPTTVCAGETVDLNIEGRYTGFVDCVSDLDIPGDGITVNSVQVLDSFHLTANITVSLTAVDGGRDIKVVTEREQTDTLTDGFTIEYPAPAIASITPSSAGNGETVEITNLSGTGFRSGATVTLKKDGEDDIDADDINVLPDGTTITCTFDLAGAATGKWNVEVTNSDLQTDTLADGFTVVEYPAPAIASITPSSGANDGTVEITNLSGTGFRDGAVVKLKKSGQTDITATGLNVVSDKKITCRYDLNGKAAGAWDLYVENTDGKSATVTGAFTVSEPEPPVPPAPEGKHTWYLAEGTSDYGFDTYVTIENPNSSEVTAAVTYMTGDGPETRPDLVLPAMSQTVINPRNDIGAADFSTKVECKEGKTICVDRRMIWTGRGAASSEGHCSVGVTAPAKIWYLAEGSSKWGFETWLLIQNPNGEVAHCNVTYMIEGAGPKTVTHDVPALSRASYSLGEEPGIGEVDASIKVESDIPVIPERAMYRNNRREGHDSIGTTTLSEDFYLAEGTTDWGFTTYLLLQNPNSEPTTVNITYMTPEGPVSQPEFTMDANSRKTINVNSIVEKRDLSAHVSAAMPIVAERAMYWDNGTGEACHDSIGMDSPHTTFYLPDGETSNGHETWTLVQNPNDTDVQVEISYLAPDGEGNVVKTETIPANSRKSFSMLEHSGIEGRASVIVTSKTAGKKIMAERAMYWNSKGAGTNTIGGYND